MKFRLLFILFGFIWAAKLPATEPAPAASAAPVIKQPVLVSVHGAWAGGWQFKKVAVLLEARGWPVLIMEANHVPMWYLPEATADLLQSIH